MRHKIITATEISGRQVYLDFDIRSTGYPCWLYSNPHQFRSDEKLQEEVEHIKADFSAQKGYYFNSRIIPDTLEIQTIGVLDTLTIKTNISQSSIDKKKAQDILYEIGMSAEDLELVLKMAKA